MRQIQFRGLRRDGKGWAYGDLLQWKARGLCAIVPQDGNEWSNPFDFEVNPETVGQFTGLTDKNGKEIFEGDTVTYYNRFSCKTYYCAVKWDDRWATFALFEDGKEYALESDWVKIEQLTVTGNIHEQ